MKDEIKEILEYFKRDDKNKFGFNQAKILDDEQAKQLLDYITNLQEENERLKQERQNIDNRNRNQKIANRKLQEEIESVRKNNRTRKNRCKKQTKKKNMYKTRNEKAIEYINISLRDSFENDEYPLNGEDFEHLLNILQNGEQNE